MKLRVIVAVVVAVLIGGSVGFTQQRQAVKLEGAWVARVTSYEGTPNPFPSPVQWSYVLAPDPSGRRATLHGSVDMAFPSTNPPPPAGPASTPLIGECVMTGPDSAQCFVIWYGVLKGSPFDTLVSIGTVHSEITLAAPGSLVVTHHFAIYAAAADKDKDGLPDPDATPLKTFTATSQDTRIGLQ